MATIVWLTIVGEPEVKVLVNLDHCISTFPQTDYTQLHMRDGKTMAVRETQNKIADLITLVTTKRPPSA